MLRKTLLLALVLALLAQVPLAAQATVGDPSARFAGIPTIEQDGKLYRFNRRLTTILLMGVDQTLEQAATASFRNGGQADFLVLVAVNDAQKTVSAIQINRDSMVELKVLNIAGQEIGTHAGQICLAHAYGDGGEMSCEMTVDAVSAMLNGTPIDYYMRMSMDGIVALNDALGGIEVTLEDDFSSLDPAMTAGTTLTLHGMQAEYYTRTRMTVGNGTNRERLARQRTYLRAATAKLKQLLEQDPGFIRTLYAQLEPYLLSSISRGAFYNLADKASRYEVRPMYEIEGTSRVGEFGFVECYVDQDSLRKALIDSMYDLVED